VFGLKIACAEHINELRALLNELLDVVTIDVGGHV
jgi:hypothetical protein